MDRLIFLANLVMRYAAFECDHKNYQQHVAYNDINKNLLLPYLMCLGITTMLM